MWPSVARGNSWSSTSSCIWRASSSTGIVPISRRCRDEVGSVRSAATRRRHHDGEHVGTRTRRTTRRRVGVVEPSRTRSMPMPASAGAALATAWSSPSNSNTRRRPGAAILITVIGMPTLRAAHGGVGQRSQRSDNECPADGFEFHSGCEFRKYTRDREGRLSRSDEQRFRELYDRTYDPVWAFVLRRTPDEEARGRRGLRDVPRGLAPHPGRSDRPPESRHVGVRHHAASPGQLVAGHKAAGTALRTYSTATR